MEAKVTLIEGMELKGEASSGHSVTMDAEIAHGGRDAGFRPMELILVALGGCTGMDVLSILRKKKQDITGFEVRVKGERAETHPMVYREIRVEYIVKGKDISEDAVKKAIMLSEEKYCSVEAMLRPGVKITSGYRIIANGS
ncbi:MAG: OsmC family protein [Nitrospirota bacterium]